MNKKHETKRKQIIKAMHANPSLLNLSYAKLGQFFATSHSNVRVAVTSNAKLVAMREEKIARPKRRYSATININAENHVAFLNALRKITYILAEREDCNTQIDLQGYAYDFLLDVEFDPALSKRNGGKAA